MKIDNQQTNYPESVARNNPDPLAPRNTGKPFSEILQTMQANRSESTVDNPEDELQQSMDRLYKLPGLTSAQHMFLNSAYVVTMHRLKESGTSVQAPSVLLQDIIQLASEFDSNLTGKVSGLPDIIRQAGFVL